MVKGAHFGILTQPVDSEANKIGYCFCTAFNLIFVFILFSLCPDYLFQTLVVYAPEVLRRVHSGDQSPSF